MSLKFLSNLIKLILCQIVQLTPIFLLIVLTCLFY